MTRPPAHAPSTGAAPPPGPRLSAAHQTRDPGAGNAAPPAGLDELLLALSVPRPVSYDLAHTALVRLCQIGAALEVCADPVLTGAGMSAAVYALRARIAFVLDHWTREHSDLDAQAWDAAHIEALTADLTEIARAAAAIRDQIAGHGPARVSANAEIRPVTPSPRHGRLPDPDPILTATRAVSAVGRLPPGAVRLLVQAAAIVAGAGIVSVVCYEAFDTAPAATRPAGEASSTSAPRTVSAASRTPSPRQATNTQRPATAVSKNPGTADSAGVSSLQIQLLGASTTEPRIEALVYLDTATTAPVTVQFGYHAAGDPDTGTTARSEEGSTSYRIAFEIDTAGYCGRPVLVEATAGGVSASETTSAQPCSASSSPSTKE